MGVINLPRGLSHRTYVIAISSAFETTPESMRKDENEMENRFLHIQKSQRK
jgi:hypothetical protein